MITIGVDLGQAQDYTAIAVQDGRVLRQLSRVDRGVSYVRQVQLVRKIVKQLTITKRGRDIKPRVVLDATGVGRAVVDMFFSDWPPVWELEPVKNQVRNSWLTNDGTSITPITIMASGHPHWGEFGFYVPKRDLVARLVRAIEYHDFQIAKGLENGELLLREMANFKMRVTTHGNMTFEAWRDKEHDDLVLACCLANYMQPVTEHEEDEDDEERMIREAEEDGTRVEECELVGFGL